MTPQSPSLTQQTSGEHISSTAVQVLDGLDDILPVKSVSRLYSGVQFSQGGVFVDQSDILRQALLLCLCDEFGKVNKSLKCRQVYDKASPGYRGRCTAPLLLDKKTKRIISSESPEILATLFQLKLPGTTDIDLAPAHLAKEANELKAIIYNQVTSPNLPLLKQTHTMHIVRNNLFLSLCDKKRLEEFRSGAP